MIVGVQSGRFGRARVVPGFGRMQFLARELYGVIGYTYLICLVLWHWAARQVIGPGNDVTMQCFMIINNCELSF
jgi:hypothetical protein